MYKYQAMKVMVADAKKREAERDELRRQERLRKQREKEEAQELALAQYGGYKKSKTIY